MTFWLLTLISLLLVRTANPLSHAGITTKSFASTESQQRVKNNLQADGEPPSASPMVISLFPSQLLQPTPSPSFSFISKSPIENLIDSKAQSQLLELELSMQKITELVRRVSKEHEQELAHEAKELIRISKELARMSKVHEHELSQKAEEVAQISKKDHDLEMMQICYELLEQGSKVNKNRLSHQTKQYEEEWSRRQSAEEPLFLQQFDTVPNVKWLPVHSSMKSKSKSNLVDSENSVRSAPTYRHNKVIDAMPIVEQRQTTVGTFEALIAVGRRMSAIQVYSQSELVSALTNNAMIELTADILLSSTLTILYTGVVIDGMGFQLDGNNAVRCLVIQNAEVTFTNLTITRGYSAFGSGMNIQSSDVTMVCCLITGNTATSTSGGGIYSTTANMVMTSCTITDNSAKGTGSNSKRGGGVYMSSSSITMTSCNITANTAMHYGGGLYITDTAVPKYVTIISCSILGNSVGGDVSSEGRGAGVAILSSSAVVTITSCTFEANNADSGGGIWLSGATVNLVGCRFTGNSIDDVHDYQYTTSTLTFHSLCPPDSFYAGTGVLGCSGCSGPADLSDTSSCEACAAPTPFACCGAMACEALALSCSVTENAICNSDIRILRAPTETPTTAPTGSHMPTLPPTPSPTSLPTLLPTPSPTPPPTIAPTVYCGGAGFYFKESEGECTKCPVGKHSNVTHAPFPTQCRVCAAGKYTSKTGLADCLICPTGKRSTVERTFCEDCSAGEYIKDAKDCAACESGRYAPQPLTGACLACGAGSFTNNYTAATTCSPCNAGRFSSSGFTAFSCTRCAAGRASVSGQSSCLACEPGKYAELQGSSTCTACAAGFAVAVTNATLCESCAAGKFQNRAGASVCEACTKGKFSSTSSSTSCSECSRGYSSSGGSESCGEQAAIGYFIFLGEVTAVCPSHSFCEGGTLMPQPTAGHWVDRRSLLYANEIYKCPRETCYMRESQKTLLNQRRLDDGSCWDMAAYRDGRNDDNRVSNLCNSDLLLCKKGARGALCGSCENTFIYSSTDKYCIACDNSQRRTVLLVVFVGAVVLVVAGLFFSGIMYRLPEIFLRISKSKLFRLVRGVDAGSLMVAWANYQILQSVSWSLDVTFPSPFKNLLGLLSFFSFDFLNPECNLPSDSNHFTTVYLWTLAPIALAFVFIFIYILLAQMPGSTTTMADLTHNLLVLGYLCVPSVSLKQLQAIDCVEVAGKSYVRIDTSVDCESNEFKVFRSINILLIAIYLSVPLIWLALLLIKRKSLNPAPTTGRDKGTPLFLRDQDRALDSLAFLYRVYRPPCYLFEVFEMYRRVLFVGVLPLLAASTDRRAILGMLFALMSIALYNETKPFRRASTNTLAITAQYANLVTYSVALAIEANVVDGIPPFAIGLFLTMINTSILCLFLYNETVRLDRERVKDNDKKERQAHFLEWAVGRSKTEIDAIMDKLEEKCLSPTHALVFWYGTSTETNAAILSGVPAIPWIHSRKVDPSLGAVVFTLHRPYELDKVDMRAFANREAMLACAVPWNLLQPYEGAREVGDGTHFPSALCVLPAQILKALRGPCFDSLLDPEPWFQGGILMPPHQIVRAYRLSAEGADQETKKGGMLTGTKTSESRHVKDEPPLHNEGADLQTPGIVSGSTDSASYIEDGYAPPLHARVIEKEPEEELPSWNNDLPVQFSSCLEFTHYMDRLRPSCQANGLEILYHYTHPKHLPLISNLGFRVSDQGHGVGGVYFSTLGPATYELGTDMYEENIIVDCFGAELLNEYKGKGMLDLCLVYGADSEVLSRARSDHATMVTKTLFQDFALPDKDGNYFLRPDRILGAFIIPASQRLTRSAEAEFALAVERAADMASNQRVGDLRHKMVTYGNELRSLHQGLYRMKLLSTHEKLAAAAVDCNAEFYGGNDSRLV